MDFCEKFSNSLMNESSRQRNRWFYQREFPDDSSKFVSKEEKNDEIIIDGFSFG